MHFLPSYLYLSREAWIGAGVGFVVAMAVMWLLAESSGRVTSAGIRLPV